MTFFEFNAKFPTEEAAIDYFIHIRYKDILTCPHCGAKSRVYRLRSHRKVCHCKHCNNSFSVFTNTIFEGSSTDIRKWFYAIHLVLNAKKGISGYQLQREIGVMYKTAWRMLKLIRTAMGNVDMSKSFGAFVEIDETYVGGKPRKENVKLDKEGNPVPSDKKPSKRGRGTTKTPVVGIKERSTGNVYAKVMLPNEEGKKLTGKQLIDVLDEVCKKDTTVITDEFKSYNILNRKTTNKYVHLSVNHSLGQFSAGDGIDVNGIENFWSIFKRSWYGIYHHMSVKYLQHYVNECAFRANHREDVEAFETLLKQTVS